MSAKQFKLSKQNPPPPPMLNAETLGIWKGWSCIGDMEVAREAATKGTHIELALLFLSTRKEINSADTLIWFNKEILSWVSELLSRKQIFKVVHILKNVNLDPIEELVTRFRTCIDKESRSYLGNHLSKIDQIDGNLRQSWILLDKINNNLDVSLQVKKKLSKELNIETIEAFSEKEKHEIAAELFVSDIDDLELSSLLLPLQVWKCLLNNSKLNIITSWVNSYYSENSDNADTFFSNFPINDQMIVYLNESNISDIYKQLVLDELCKFGVFSSHENSNITNIIQRFCNIKHLDVINYNLLQNNSTINKNKFYELLTTFCNENKLYHLLGFCIDNYNLNNDFISKSNSNHLNLILSLKNVFDFKTCDVNTLRTNIFQIVEFISEDILLYLKENPIILLSLIILSNDVDLLKVLITKDQNIVINNFSVPVQILLKAFPVINNITNKLKISSYKSELNLYDLLAKHNCINTNEIYDFRYISDKEMPNFSSLELVEKYGYNKKINFLIYVKLCRPGMASILYYNSSSFNQKDISYTMNKIQNLAFRNFRNNEIVSSCIVFLEMIGQSSDFIRSHIFASRLIIKSNQELTGDVIDILNDLSGHCEEFCNLLETVIMESIKLNCNSDGKYLISAIKQYEIVVKLCKLHDLALPTLFLQYTASNNLWLDFIIYAQLKNYSLELTQRSLQYCRNNTLWEHIQHCLANDIKQTEKRNALKSRDSRSFYLSRIGMRKNVTMEHQQGVISADQQLMYSSVTSQSSYGSATSSSGLSDFIEGEASLDSRTNLLQVIIKCHNSTDPPKALLQACQYYDCPLLAVLATSYEPDSVVKNWLTWLTVSCDIHKQFVIYDKVTTSASLVAEILQTVLRKGFCGTLEQSFHIFLSDNPLKLFVKFLNECLKLNFNETILKLHLDQFKSKLQFKRNNSVVMENDHEMTYLSNKTWIEKTAMLLLATVLQYNFKSKHHQKVILEILQKFELQEHFISHVPDFISMQIVQNCLIKTSVALDFSVIFDRQFYRREIEKCVDKLLAKNEFENALEIAQIEQLEVDKIVVDKWHFIYKNKQVLDWNECNNEFLCYKVEPKLVVDFFLHYATLDDTKAVLTLLKLAQKWAAEHNLENLFEIENKLWLIYFKQHPTDFQNKFEMSTSFTNFTYKVMLAKIDAQTVKYSDTELPFSALDSAQIENAITALLNVGDVFQALRFARMFAYKCNDLELITLCMSIAEGVVLPYQLTAEQRMLIMKGTTVYSLNHRRRAFLSTRLTSISSASHSPYPKSLINFTDQIDPTVQDAIACMESLIERLRAGVEFAQRVLMIYRISINIERKYNVVMECKEPYLLLKTALAEDCRNKLEVVHDFIMVYKWTREQISDFLCAEIITALTIQTRSKIEHYLLWDHHLDSDFPMILQLLLDNCTPIAHKLYGYASALQRSAEESSGILSTTSGPLGGHHGIAVGHLDECTLVIECLVRAHDCYTADCNMEGISVILKKCRTMIGLLLTMKCWKLIVRLLTGVARYTEMNYVFQILRENDQFEFLLRKGSRKDNGLKVALLEYLKKYCPENRELYRMVALHFTLFSEVAELWENEADSLIKNLITISKLEMQNQRINPDAQPYIVFTNTDGTKLCLNKAMVNYTHAAEYHLQGEKLSKAMRAAKQAELIALQLSTLKSTSAISTCLLQLTTAQITNVVCSELTFPQSLILIEAYNYNADWATIIYNQFIVNNKALFFDQFLQSYSLTDTLVHNISRRYLSGNIFNETSVTNMKTIINKVKSVRVKYKIASELVLTDIVEDLLAGDQLAYLKDTVWKMGYKE